jgi:hypothetical protein
MQHRVQVGPRFYSVTVIQEGERDWVAVAEVPGGWLVRNGRTRQGVLDQWQAAAMDAAQQPAAMSKTKRNAKADIGA